MKSILLSIIASCAMTYVYANTTPYTTDLSGIWTTVNDSTGLSQADVIMIKNDDGSYTGKILSVRPISSSTLTDFCTKCKGDLKDQPFVGLEILSNISPDPNQNFEFKGAKLLNLQSGNINTAKAKLNSRGNRLSLIEFSKSSPLGRSETWIRKN